MKIPEPLTYHIQPLLPLATRITPSGILTVPVKAILFDIYGTLFISASGDISLAEKEAGRHALIEELLHRYAIEMKAEDLLEALFGAIKETHTRLKKNGIQFPEVEIDKIWKMVLNRHDPEQIRSFAVEYEMISNPVYPMPDLAELLEACRKKNLYMGIISNAQFYTPLLFEWFLGNALKDLGFEESLLFYSYRYGRAKPSTFLYEQARQQLTAFGIAPTEVLYVGNDMLNDIFPAQKTGFKTALFAGDRRSLRLRREDARCRNLKPDLVVTGLMQVIEKLS